MQNNPQAVIEDVFRREHGRVMAALISQFADFTLAEDALQDAFLQALESWQTDGVPHNPAAWLTTVAKRRAVDKVRRQAAFAHRHADLHALSQLEQPDPADEDDSEMRDNFPDERLKLMFTCCHPSLSLEAQIALTLRTLGGLSTAEIARAFLVPIPTMAQRLNRAKQKIQAAGIPYRVPPLADLPERLDALLHVLYLIFNEGYCATSGEALVRQALCQEAIRLCRILISLLPATEISAEARGLLALMLLHDSRRAARTDANGDVVLLADQDRSTWNLEQIAEGIGLLDEAFAMRKVGVYQVQAAISALHAEAPSADQTDWRQIAALYEVLMSLAPSMVVAVNHAVAVGMPDRPQAGLALLYQLSEAAADYYPYHAACADLLRRSGQREAAADAYRRALALCQNAAERAYFQRCLQALR